MDKWVCKIPKTHWTKPQYFCISLWRKIINKTTLVFRFLKIYILVLFLNTHVQYTRFLVKVFNLKMKYFFRNHLKNMKGTVFINRFSEYSKVRKNFKPRESWYLQQDKERGPESAKREVGPAPFTRGMLQKNASCGQNTIYTWLEPADHSNKLMSFYKEHLLNNICFTIKTYLPMEMRSLVVEI